MALTRAQLLAGDSGQGVVLPGQVQGVSQGAGVLIAPNGQISVDASTVTGLVKLNNPFAFNSYVWPNANGANGTFLSTDASGVLSWRPPAGLAVVTVSPTPPAPTDVGELWYDCTTGYLKVFQNCVDPNGWTKVAEPGLPVEPTSTSALPPFVRGLGTIADPYECVVATVAAGSAIFIVNEVTVTGLAPNQFVPIVDENAVLNGGRFHFSNNYADASGTLVFQTIFIDLPSSLSGTNYTAFIRVGWSTAYIEAFVDVIDPMVLLTPGTIAGTAQVGSVLTYTQGTATGGVTPLNYNWTWLDDLGNTLQSGGPSYIIQQTDLGREIFVRLVVTDSATPPNSVGGDTNSIGPIAYRPIPIPTDWNPTPADGMDFVPGGISGPYTGPGTAATSTGCIELSVNGAPYDQGPQALASGDNLAIRWIMSSACGEAPSGTVLTGTISDGVGTNEYTVTIDRLPSPFGFNTLTDVQPSSLHSSSTVGVNNINATAFVTLSAGNTAPAPLELTKDGGTTWFTVPAAPSTLLTVNNGDNIQLRFTTGSTLGQLYTGLINIGDGDNVKFTPSAPGFRVTNAVNPVFPNTNFNPTGGPNAAPVTVNIPAQSLYGKATATWADGSVSLTSTGALLFQVNGGGYGVGSTNIINGDTIDICWDLTQVNAAANGAVLAGAFTDGVYTNSYNLTIDRNTDGYDFSDLTNQLLNTPVVSNTVAPVGFNVPIQLTYAPGTPNPLTSVQANIATTGFFNVPTAAPGLYVNPGQNIQLKATTGTAYTTPYDITTTLGAGASATDLWTVTTGSTAPLVVTPSIVTPNNGATGVATTVNVTGSAYINQNGAGTQASSDWQIYQAIPVQAKTSSIINVAQGAGNTQIPYPEGLPGDPLLDVYLNNTSWYLQGGGEGNTIERAFDGSTSTAYINRVYTAVGSGNPVTPAPAPPTTPPYTGWYPTVPIPFSTSVELWGQGVVRLVVDGTPGALFTLTPGVWNVLDIGSGNLEGIEWRGTTAPFVAPVPIAPSVISGWYQYNNIYLSAVRVDGSILNVNSQGQESYPRNLPGVRTIKPPTPVSVAYYVENGGIDGTERAFDGNTSTSYTATVYTAYTSGSPFSPPPLIPVPPPYTGWYPTLPIPFSTSVEVWGAGTIRTVVNGVSGPDFNLTAGVWNTINIGSGNLEAIEWRGSSFSWSNPAGSSTFGQAAAIPITLNAVRVDGTILNATSQGQQPYSFGFPGPQLITPLNDDNSAVFIEGGGAGGPRRAFDGDTSSTYTATVFSNYAVGSPPPAPPTTPLYTGWYPTLPVPFNTSVEIWGSGTIRTVVNGVPGPDFLLTAGTWNIINIGAGNLEAIEWKSTTVPFTAFPAVPNTSGWYQLNQLSLNAVRVDGVILTDRGTIPTTVLTLSNNTNLSNFSIGDTVREINAGGGLGDAQGTITAINSAIPTITVQTTAGTWTVGSSVENVSGTPVDPGPPTTNPPSPTSYTQVVDVTGDTVNLTSYPLVGLPNNNIFYARVQYNSNLIVTSSGFSPWSKFTTV